MARYSSHPWLAREDERQEEEERKRREYREQQEKARRERQEQEYREQQERDYRRRQEAQNRKRNEQNNNYQNNYRYSGTSGYYYDNSPPSCQNKNGSLIFGIIAKFLLWWVWAWCCEMVYDSNRNPIGFWLFLIIAALIEFAFGKTYKRNVIWYIVEIAFFGSILICYGIHQPIDIAIYRVLPLLAFFVGCYISKE